MFYTFSNKHVQLLRSTRKKYSFISAFILNLQIFIFIFLFQENKFYSF